MAVSAMPESPGVEYLKALECIGCGRLEGPQPCVGICQDRIVDLVYAREYEGALAQAELARQQAKAFEALVRQLAWTTPRGGEWERSYRMLQDQARRILGSRPPG
jgi:hypothetical protein